MVSPTTTEFGQADLAMGLSADEYEHVLAGLGREPNRVELAVFAGMWSEHCSYKSTRELLATLPTAGPRVLAGPGAHAGCVDVGGGWAVAFKIESHNHPSAVEPYQGALTGVGGILRDIVAQGARPVAVMDGLCFGDPRTPRTRWLRDGIVAGIGGYGNAYGVPNVGGTTVYDRRYEGNPLVNALAAGLIRHDGMRTAAAAGPGNVLLYVGATTGRDGILGAAFASEELGHSDEHAGRRSHVQVGDPFAGKKLMEACLAFTPEQGLIAGQDLGACGIACAVSEMAAAGGTGFDVDLEEVPLRETGIAPVEVLLSESQERFLFVVDASRHEEAIAHFRSHGVHAAAIGSVTDGGRLRIRSNGVLVADLPAALVAGGAPSRRWESGSLPEPVPYPDFPVPDELGSTLLDIMSIPGGGDAAALYERYDQTVGNRTIRGPGRGEAAVLRLPGGVGAFALDLVGGGMECASDPYLGVQALLGASVRNLACVGATAVAVTDGLNVGSPSDPLEYARLTAVVHGLGDGLRRLGIAVTGGNCSLYNESPLGAIPPTPIIGTIGLIDRADAVPGPALTEGEVVFLVGTTRPTPTLSRYGTIMTGRESGPPPAVDLDADARLAEFLVEQCNRRRVGTAKDVGRGGAASALATLCLRSGIGVHIGIEDSGRPDWVLFGEYPGCAWVTASVEHAPGLAADAHRSGLEIRRAGVAGGDRFVVDGLIDLRLDELAAAHARGAS
jgi:phosphoribosylformylglycinamidine synthase II